jgi:hypothetical protein
MDIRTVIFAVFASLFSTGVYAAPVYYTFDVQLTYVYDDAGLASTEGIEVGDTLGVVFLVDRELDGTETRLSMYPFLNQKYTNTKYDTTYNNGHTVYDYFYADMITPPLLHGDSWDDMGQIEANYGSAVQDNSVYYFNLYGSDSPDTTGALTTLTSYAVTSTDFLGAEFRFKETATINQGGNTLTSSLTGTAYLVDISDTYIAPVPIPGAAWLFASALMLLTGFARTKRVRG